MREYVNRGGNAYAKHRMINDIVLEEFILAMEEGWEVHDRDLEEWGQIAAEQLNLPNFHASPGWVLNFKRRNKIVDRKEQRGWEEETSMHWSCSHQ